jgi:diketogulonate reductase-like aldo/keto reductase
MVISVLTAALAMAPAANMAMSPTVEIAPGVHMPMLNLGTCCGSKPSVGLLPRVEAGGRGIDTAWDYFDQGDVGKGIAASSVPRSDLFVLTKVPPVLDALKMVKTDLKQLNIDQADLILLHNPTTKKDNAAQYAKLEQALAMNLTRAIGISDFSKTQVQDLLETAKVIPAVHQSEMSVGKHDDENIQFARDHNITYEAWNVVKGCDTSHPTVVAAAAAHNASTFQVCLRYIIDRGCVMAVGTGKDASTVASFAQENLAIFNFKLTDDEVTALSAI